MKKRFCDICGVELTIQNDARYAQYKQNREGFCAPYHSFVYKAPMGEYEDVNVTPSRRRLTGKGYIAFI